MPPQTTTERASTQDSLRAALLAELRSVERAAPLTTEARVLAYERVSKSVQVSIPDQKRAIEADVARNGIDGVARHRWSVGRSRWESDGEYRALLADIDSGEYTHLWLFNGDRLGGDDQEFVHTVERALKKDMVVRDTVHGEITGDMARFLGMMSYFEIKNNHYRVVLKLEGKHLEGVKLGRVPTGYEPQCKQPQCRCGKHGKHVRSEPLASLVEQAFERCAAGQSLHSLTQWWNAQTGQRRDPCTLRRMLQNPYYVGIIVNRRWKNGHVEGRGKRTKEDWKVATHEQPLNVSMETFATVQARLRTQENAGRPRRTGPSHALLGLLHCARCQRRVHRRLQYSGATTHRWECPLCLGGRSERRIEGKLHELLAQIPFPEEDAVRSYASEQERMRRALRQEIAAIDAECDKWNRRIKVWEDDRADGTMTKERYRERMTEANAALEQLRQQRAALEDSHIGQPGRAVLLEEVRAKLREMHNWTETIAKRPLEERQAMYRCLIKAIRFEFDAGLMTVEYTDALARWYGCASDTVPLPSQKRKEGNAH